jgi:mRNA-degrading endonuclease RelE of RelBE toxin-antitoxin system
MIFIETQIFTKQISAYLSDDDYSELQNFLSGAPDAGDLIQGTGGLRKLRWKSGGKGKRGGVRIIYYWQVAKDQIYLMTLYAKNEMADLSAKEKKLLKQMVERW